MRKFRKILKELTFYLMQESNKTKTGGKALSLQKVGSTETKLNRNIQKNQMSSSVFHFRLSLNIYFNF